MRVITTIKRTFVISTTLLQERNEKKRNEKKRKDTD